LETSLLNQLKFSWKFSKPYKGALSLYLVSQLAGIALSLMFIWYSKQAIDLAVGSSTEALYQQLIPAVLCLLGSFVLGIYGYRLNEKTRITMLVDLQKQILQGQMTSSWKNSSDWHTGDLLVRANTDSSEIVQVLGNVLISVVVTLVRIIGAVGLLWWMDPMLAIILLCVSPLVLFSKIYLKKLKKLNQQLKKSESSLGETMQENLRMRLFIRAINLEDKRWQEIEKKQNNIYDMKMSVLNFTTFSRGFMGSIINIGYLITFVWGVLKLQSGEITFGTMSAFLQLVARIQGPILTMFGYIPVLVRFRTAVDRVMELFSRENEPTLPAVRLKPIDQITLKNISFSYGQEPLLSGINLTIKKGEPTAILGHSGQGKSTLLRIILNLIPQSTGTVSLFSDGKEIPMSSAYRNNFAYVPQGDKLLSGTIRENLSAMEELAEEDINQALELSRAEFVHQLPAGLENTVAEGAHGLSEGQGQRLGIARALLQDAQVWLLDEITSALDKQTAMEVVKNLVETGKDKVIVFVTHDPAIASLCTQIIVLDAPEKQEEKNNKYHDGN